VKNLTTFSQLQLQFQISDFVEKTVFQINKDLNGLINETLIIDFENSENKLVDLISELIPLLIKLVQISHLQQYIYKVDLNEKQWVRFVRTQDLKKLSEQIIIREAQKVYIKEMFKSA
jgi:hypothetical protein